jgi:hypothetical protein
MMSVIRITAGWGDHGTPKTRKGALKGPFLNAMGDNCPLKIRVFTDGFLEMDTLSLCHPPRKKIESDILGSSTA